MLHHHSVSTKAASFDSSLIATVCLQRRLILNLYRVASKCRLKNYTNHTSCKSLTIDVSGTDWKPLAAWNNWIIRLEKTAARVEGSFVVSRLQVWYFKSALSMLLRVIDNKEMWPLFLVGVACTGGACARGGGYVSTSSVNLYCQRQNKTSLNFSVALITRNMCRRGNKAVRKVFSSVLWWLFGHGVVREAQECFLGLFFFLLFPGVNTGRASGL